MSYFCALAGATAHGEEDPAVSSFEIERKWACLTNIAKITLHVMKPLVCDYVESANLRWLT